MLVDAWSAGVVRVLSDCCPEPLVMNRSHASLVTGAPRGVRQPAEVSWGQPRPALAARAGSTWFRAPSDKDVLGLDALHLQRRIAL